MTVEEQRDKLHAAMHQPIATVEWMKLRKAIPREMRDTVIRARSRAHARARMCARARAQVIELDKNKAARSAQNLVGVLGTALQRQSDQLTEYAPPAPA